MTAAPDVAPLGVRGIHEAVAALRDRGLRLSTPRRLVLEALFEADAPVSAEQLAQRKTHRAQHPKFKGALLGNQV